MTDRYKYGTLIARMMGDRITPEEERELDEWVCADEKNRKLFEDLTNDFNSKWAKQWFKEAGVRTRFIRWRNMDGWYKPENKPMRDFYILAIAVFAAMALVYLVIKYL